MITYKVKYKTYIVNLYVPEHRSGKVILLLPGLPMSTSINNILKPFLDAGAVVFYPYFSGSYDSEGSFGATSSIRDVAALYPLTQKADVTELYFGKKIQLGVPKETILAGMSYGAVAALLGHRNLYQKILFLSPAMLFNPADIGVEGGKDFREQMKSLLRLLKKAYHFTYRISSSRDLEKLLLGQSDLIRRNSITESLNEISCPSLVLHGENDTTVPVGVIRSLESEVRNKNVSWRYVDSTHNTSSYDEETLALIRMFVKE